ncbi:MAG: amino acid permease [Polyangiaceae bacterium]|nr:amino acid permease [Polyangiaceae bacterium]
MNRSDASQRREVGLSTATFIVVANMVGTGVFTSLGFQVVGIRSTFALLALWLLGGVYALAGALCYGELAAAMPQSGGEYHFLSRLYHPAVGFVAGWVSATVGFAAPVAAASMAFGRYLSRVFPELPPTAAALTVAVVVSAVHLASLKARSTFQGMATTFKIVLVVGLIACGLALAKGQPVGLVPGKPDWLDCLSPAFAVSLVYVTYSYSGWNASVYLAGEVKDPGRTIPRSLLLGTAIVTLLYLLVNFVFLYSTPKSVLAGQVEVGYLAGERIFGPVGGRIMGLLISIGLISSISSMTWAGPRVLWALADDMPVFRRFAHVNKHGVPHRAVLVQLAIVVALVLTSSFDAVITYLGFTLAVCTFMAVLGVFVLRYRRRHLERPYQTWGYPVTPVVFLLVSAWMLVYLLVYRPVESMIGLATIVLGLVVYIVSRKKAASENPSVEVER